MSAIPGHETPRPIALDSADLRNKTEEILISRFPESVSGMPDAENRTNGLKEDAQKLMQLGREDGERIRMGLERAKKNPEEGAAHKELMRQLKDARNRIPVRIIALLQLNNIGIDTGSLMEELDELGESYDAVVLIRRLLERSGQILLRYQVR
jgi:hypothetical protein